MKFTDVIKKSVLENFQVSDLGTGSIILTLAVAIALGLFIYLIYRINTRSGFYNRGFNKSLAVLPLITSAIMLAMSSNLTISLGMVGALSIVRFRNAVKDPIDLTYLFWSISIGIIVGAGIYKLAVLMSLAVALLITLLDLLPKFRTASLLVVSGTNASAEKKLISCAKDYAKFVKVSSRNVSKTGVEWILELSIKDNEAKMIKKIANIDDIESVHLMTHDGEVRF